MTLSIATNRTFAFCSCSSVRLYFCPERRLSGRCLGGTSTGGQEHFADLYAMLKAGVPAHSVNPSP